METLKISTKLAVLLVAALFMAQTGAALAGEATQSPFDRLTDAALSYFVPMEGAVASVDGDVITTDELGAEDGVKAGMRLVITRKGKPFVHPITKEPLGKIETTIGKAEVIEAGAGSAKLRVLSGSPQEGDVLRLSSAQVTALFFQSDEVDWNLSEEYYSRLRNTRRFALIDTAPRTATDEEIAAEARERGADIAIALYSRPSGTDTVLGQKILWAEDQAVLSSEETTISGELLADLKLGNELFTPGRSFVVRLEVPAGVSFVRAGDIDGDGVVELVMGTPSTISFHRPTGTLDPALGGAKIKSVKGRDLLWVDVQDIDGDKRDDIIITRKNGGRIESLVYAYKDNSFKKLLESNLFLRAIGGRLYGQKHVEGIGYRGPVYPVVFGSSASAGQAGALELPDNVNIYDFSFMESPEGERVVVAFGEDGYLNLYGEKGTRIWRSRGTYGGYILKYRKDTTIFTGDEYWSVKNRIYVAGKSALTIKRNPLAKQAEGVGYKNSMLVALHWAGPALQESALVEKVPGNVLDFEVYGNQAYVLSRPFWGFDAKKLLKGKNPLVNTLFIYSLKGY